MVILSTTPAVCGRQILVHPSLMFAILPELEHGSDTGERFLPARHPSKTLILAHRIRELGAVKLTLDGLVIEEVNMTWPSSHEHVNNTLRLPGKMRDTLGKPPYGCIPSPIAEPIRDGFNMVLRAAAPIPFPVRRRNWRRVSRRGLKGCMAL